jgi:hypothetical protein
VGGFVRQNRDAEAGEIGGDYPKNDQCDFFHERVAGMV